MTETSTSDRVCESCGQSADGKRCANDQPDGPSWCGPLVWHEHDCEQWYCGKHATGYGDEFFTDGHPFEVVDSEARS